MWGSLSGRVARSYGKRGMRLFATIGLGAGIACSFGAQASAQVAPEYHFLPNVFGEDVPRGETVRSRARPELDALGLHVGSFYIFPTLTNAITYTDNVYASHSDAVGDIIYTLAPVVTARSDWSRHAISVSAGGRFGFYFDEVDENYKDAFANASGTLDITSNTRMRSNLSLQRGHEERGDPNDVSGAEPTIFYTYAGGLEGSHRFNRVTISVGGEVRRLDYEDVDSASGVIDQDDRDRLLYRPAVKAAYEFHPGFSAFVRAEGEITQYDDRRDKNGFIRDSQGFDVVGGAALDLTGLLFGDVYAGVRQRYFDDSRFDSIFGPVIGATLTWIPTGLTTVTLKADSQFIESTGVGTSGYNSTGIGVTVDHELLRNLILTGTGGFRYDDFEGIAREDRFLIGSVGADYLWNRYLSLGARYSYSLRDSDAPGNDFSRNLISLLLTAKL
jgi:hypothetical protein